MKSIYWYENDKQLLAGEVAAMKKFFPSFKLMKMADGRLYWRGTVNPSGKGGGVWDLMVIYDNNHPYTDNENTYGGSIDVYPVKPNLAELQKKLGNVNIPHIYWKNNYKEAYICTVRANEFKSSETKSSTAAGCLSWACKWIVVFELWLNGDIPFDSFRTDKHIY